MQFNSLRAVLGSITSVRCLPSGLGIRKVRRLLYNSSLAIAISSLSKEELGVLGKLSVSVDLSHREVSRLLSP